MALTSANTALVQRLYAKQLFTEFPDEMFFKKFMGEGINNIIQVKTNLKKDKGDRFIFGLVMNLTGEGVEGDSELEGNEEQMVTYDDVVTVDQKRNAVRVTGRLEEQKASYNIRETAKERLKFWFSEIHDQVIFDHLSGDTSKSFPATPLAPDTGSTGHNLWGGNATSTATIDSADTFTASLLSKAKVRAQTITPKVRPLKMKGKEFWVCVIHPHQMYDLRQDTDWQNAHYFANDEGLSNPIFDGSAGIYDGVVIHVHPKVFRTSAWGSGGNLEGARALFMGAQAGLQAVASEPTWIEKDFDYDNQTGVATGQIWGVKKARFNSKDFAIIALDTYAAAP